MLLRYQRAILIGFTLLIYSLQGYTNVVAVDQIISEQEGKTVIVPCPVNKDKCGELHSLNWFKGDNRIAAMLLDDSNVTSVAEEFEDRVSVEQNPFRLIIRNLQISDEDIYLCDTTYFIPIETCDNFNGHRVELNVLENLVPPSEVVILDEKGDRIENGSIVGPMQERQTIKATCIVKNTRPQPQVGWWRGNKRLTTHSPSYDEKDGLFTATLELSLQLSRDDLGQSIECHAESAAIQNTIKNQFSVDLQVRPTTVTINGVEHHTVQGSKVVLTCDVHGARPPVNLTWFNASQPMDPEENDLMEIRTRAFEKEDGTYHTQSDLIFNASRFENDVKFVCQAENIVLQINREAPMQSLLTLEVLYPPVVKVSPSEITVNTSDTVLLNCEYVANPASLDQVVWYRNGEVVNVNDTQRYEGGNSENVALVIRSTDKRDIGNYTCQLSNSIGKGVSEQQIDLDVQFVPVVEVLMIPEGPVKESDESNVTLFCNILDANPSLLTKVRWYANATLLKELPDCEETREDLCHIDPSKLLLESIGRGFFYNYSCEGYNAAGWGPRSEEKELLVHYEPGPAALTHFPLVAVKKKSVTFSCAVDDPGYPESNSYKTQSSSLASAISLTSPSLPQIHFYTIQALTASEIEEAYEALIGENFQKQQLKQQVKIHNHFRYHNHHHNHQHDSNYPYQDSKHNRNQYHAHYRHNQNIFANENDDNDDDDDDDYDDNAGGTVNSNSFGQQEQHKNVAGVNELKENPHIKPKHVLKETHALIDLTNNSLCTLLTLTTFSPQSQILTLLTHTPPTVHGYGNGNNNNINNNAAANIKTAKYISMSSLSSSSSSSPSSSSSLLPTTQPTATLSFYRKMGKFSFHSRSVMPLPRYRWLRGGRGPLQDIVTKDWTVEPVGLDSRTNYSCYAFNEGGKGVMATVNLEVHAPPFFIKNLSPYTGVLHTSRNANLTCRIECVPRCEISWLKDGVAIEKNDTRYFVKDKYMDASPATGDFESMLSVLHFNMSNWPNNKFDIEEDNANYTCVSTGNTVGPGIKSATYFSIQYAPDNTTVSEEVVYVQEETIPGRVICKSRANPEPTYEWRFDNKTVIRGNALIINTPMKRNETGRYTCVAFNKHGISTAETFIDVQFKPRCEIERQEIEDKDTLICTAYGNPEEADFSWSIKAENETVEWLGNGDHKTFKNKSYYELKEDYAIARTYRCVANNTAGIGTFCEIEVAEQLGWWQRWDKTTLIILVAGILLLLLAVIIICCIIICICRRRRRQDKLQEKSSSMADPLTEPGEYENLPFHGLQTAPNKFTTPTTPTNFNNNTNVVRSVPRPKRLNGNISQNTPTTQPTFYDEHETEAQQQQQQQQYYHQQQQYSTMPYNRHTQYPATKAASATLSGMQTLTPNSSVPARNDSGIIVHNSNNSTGLQQHQQQQNNLTVAPATTNSSPHQMAYNLNNCFPKSYTEYYQLQQQQQQNPQSQQHQQYSQKINNSGMAGASPHIINAIEQDFNTYAVVERQHPQQNANATVKVTATAGAAAVNPFLAVSNFKKFDTSGDEDLQPGNYQSNSMKRQGKRKTFADKLEDKRFYSLKFSSNNNKQKAVNKSSAAAAAALNLNHSFNGVPGGGGGGVLGSLLSSNKCKRHHSFAGGGLGDVDPKGPVKNPHMHFYDPPAYENINDAVQVHSSVVSDMELPDDITSSAQTATVLLHPLPYGIAGGSQGPKKKHHQRQHQPKEDLNLIEPERLSIYRSDSGISNSSYECVTPLTSTQTPCSTPPPGKIPRTPKTPKTPKAQKNQTLAHTAVTAHFNSSHKKPAPRVPPAPLYMNLNDQQHAAASNISNLERPTSPTSTMATSAYESASSSQNDNTCNDPVSLSSTTSLYSAGGSGGCGNKSSLTAINQRCSRHQQPPEITTPEEFEQYQLGHHAHAHFSSSLSVASSISASGSNTGAGGRVKCKKQQQQRLNSQGNLINHMELNKRKTVAHNPFLAANPAAASATTCHKKLHRRQTISDPYAHIKHINECRQQFNNANIDNSRGSSSGGNNSNKTHNYCPKSPSAFKTATAAATPATTTTTSNDTQSSAATCSPYKSQQQQQQHVSLQRYSKAKQSSFSTSSSSLPYSTATTSCPQYAAHHQQMLMHKNVVNNCKSTIDDNGRPYNEVVIHVVDNENNNNVTAAGHDYYDRGDQSFNMPHHSLYCDVANNTHNKNTKEYTQANQMPKRGHHNRSLSNTTNLLYPTLEDATQSTLSTDALGYMKRPLKLPLRKYHTFHFQPTQTVVGQQTCKLQELHQNYLQFAATNNSSLTQPYAKQGPLVFRPYEIDENVTFKPIQPSEESEDSLDCVREYVGTVEKFLKDEEKYLDSGDFTNLTQRLKQQQHFLKSNNSPLTKEGEEADNKLFPSDLNKNYTQTAQNAFHSKKSRSQGKKEAAETQKHSFNTLENSEDKPQQFAHSSRALNLLKTVIENDSFQSEEELSIKPQNLISEKISISEFSRDQDQNSPNSFYLQRKPASNSLSSNLVENNKESTNSPKVSKLFTILCDKSEICDNVGVANSPNDSSLAADNKSYGNTIRNTSKLQDIVKSPNSPKVYSLYKNSKDAGNDTDVRSEHNFIGFHKISNSTKFSTPTKVHENSENIKKTTQNRLNLQNTTSPEEIYKSPKALVQPLGNTNFTTGFNKNSAHTCNNKEQTASVSITIDSNNPNDPTLQRHNRERGNSPKQPGIFLSRKSLKFSLDNNKTKGNIKAKENVMENEQVEQDSTASVLSQIELEKLFKPYEENKKLQDLYELASPRIVSTALNPAASLEALEMLTKSNPELWTSNQAGSRHNLHQLELFHTLQQQNESEKTKQLQHLDDDEDEDLGYSFCEDENDDTDEDDVQAQEKEANSNEQKSPASPHVTLLVAPNSQLPSQVKYILTQNHGEIHI